MTKTKTKYRALTSFQGHAPGDEFEAKLDPWLAQQYEDQGHIEPVTKTTKKEDKKDDG